MKICFSTVLSLRFLHSAPLPSSSSSTLYRAHTCCHFVNFLCNYYFFTKCVKTHCISIFVHSIFSIVGCPCLSSLHPPTPHKHQLPDMTKKRRMNPTSITHIPTFPIRFPAPNSSALLSSFLSLKMIPLSTFYSWRPENSRSLYK